MAFSNEAALKAALVAACTTAVAQVEEKVHGTFNEKLNKFYGEFTPAEYIRTNALMGSLQRTGATSTGNGAVADVYFTTPSYQTGWIPIQSTPVTGRLGWASWSGGQVLDTAMHGSHGGYAGGTAVWDEGFSELGGESGIKAMLLNAVISAL